MICRKLYGRLRITSVGWFITKDNFSDFRLIFSAKLVVSEMHSGIAFWGIVKPDVSKAPEKDRTKYTYAGHLVMFPSGYGMYDLFGRNVALAARITGQAEGGEILVSESVREAVDGVTDIDFGTPREAELKGFQGSYSLYPVNLIA